MKLKLKLFGLAMLFSVFAGIMPVSGSQEAQAASVNFATPPYYEMFAKLYLLKNEPTSSFGMFQGPFLTKTQLVKQAAKQKLSFKKEATAYFKAHPDTAQFLQGMSGVTDNVSMYRMVQKMDLIHLTKTSDGYTYHFQGGSGCAVEEYTGTLTMDQSIVTDDIMEMHEHPIAC